MEKMNKLFDFIFLYTLIIGTAFAFGMINIPLWLVSGPILAYVAADFIFTIIALLIVAYLYKHSNNADKE